MSFTLIQPLVNLWSTSKEKKQSQFIRPTPAIQAAKNLQKTQGKFLNGTKPFGFKVEPDGTLVKDEGEQKAIRKIKRMHKQGKALRVISKALLDDSDIKLSYMGVQNVLKG